MFRIHDHELAEAELAIFQTTAKVEPDGFIRFPGQARKTERSTYNLAELLLEWSTAEEFGVQRIRLGVHEPLTRLRWKSRLFRRTKKYPESLHVASVQSRKVSIRACFPSEAVRFRTLGWRLLNVEYWTPGKAIKIAEAKEARITHVLVNQCSDKSTSRRGVKTQ